MLAIGFTNTVSEDLEYLMKKVFRILASMTMFTLLIQLTTSSCPFPVRNPCKTSIFTSLDINEKVSSVCSQCLISLIEEDTFDLDVTDPVYGLIFSNDKGGLKCPSVPVLEAVVKLCKVYSRIEMDSSLFSLFLTGPSRQILVSLNIKSHREGGEISALLAAR